MRVGPKRRLSSEELMLLNCGAGEDSWESLGLQKIKLVNPKGNPEYSLEGLTLKLKLQYFGHLMRRADSLEKTLMLGKIKGKKRRGWKRIRWLDNNIDSMDMNLSKLQKIVKDREPGMLQSMGSQRVRHSLVTGQHNNNNNTCGYVCSCFCFSLTVPFFEPKFEFQLSGTWKISFYLWSLW